LQQLSEQGRQRIDELTQRYSVSTDAVMTLLQSLVNSNGTMAQFNHWELGGGGQWMRGGMTMVGDMFNHGLKTKVEGLCSELSQLLTRTACLQRADRCDLERQTRHLDMELFNGLAAWDRSVR
jgi:hypothetical protein